MSMTANAFVSWLDSYGQAWESRDPQAAANLFAEEGTYQVTPFVEPMRGKPAILEYWTNVARTQQNIQFGYEILAVTPDHGIARWWASFVIVPPGLQTKLDGIFLISLNGNGRCVSLREWWHKQQD
jgi:SnoaL-like protein